MSILDDIGRAVSFLREREDKSSKVLMPKAAYDKLDPELIAEKEREFDCKIVSVEHKVQKPKRKVKEVHYKPQDAMRFKKRKKR
jgi:hypothetical protein